MKPPRLHHLVDVTTPETARRSVERNVRQRDAAPEALVAAGNMAMLQGYPDLALEGFRRVLTLAPDGDGEAMLMAHLGEGTALHALRDYQAASASFEQTVVAADQSASTVVRGFALAWLADCQAALGDHAAAEESLASAAACADVVGNEELEQITRAIRQKLAARSS
ncbi:MAG: hypothetical protein EOO75_07245 [Myxococcales bacterium]|nr:MAG: hypothetical protein EOO75_07245 [Myxococcales bacterium]